MAKLLLKLLIKVAVMTTVVDICNRALLVLGSQRTISSLSQDSVEAKACNQIYPNVRDDLLRMAPWNCAFNTTNLTYITSIPGTPENTSSATNLWQKGQPAPPWAYEYQYPVDCLRPCWITPQTATGFAGGIPITTAVTGGASTTWFGGPVVFKVGIDSFFSVVLADIVGAGASYVPNEIITLVNETYPFAISNGQGGTFQPGQPQGAPPLLRVLTVNGAGGILTVEPYNTVIDSLPLASGSLFYKYTDPVAQNYSSSNGVGGNFNLHYTLQSDQRVILTNQEFAILNYIKRVTDPNVFDTLFQSALQNIIAAQLVMTLVGDKNLANQCIAGANASIAEARKADGNEGLTINDVTPDWIRVRGVCWTDTMTNGPYSGFDWGGLWNSWA